MKQSTRILLNQTLGESVYFAREWRVQGCLRSGEDKLGNAWFRFNRHDEEKKNLICGPRLPVAT